MASFYSFFDREPGARYTVRLSNCVVDKMNGMQEVAAAFEKAVGIRFGQTTPDGQIGLRYTSCTGMCDQAPAALINGLVVTGIKPADVPAIVEALKREHGKVGGSVLFPNAEVQLNLRQPEEIRSAYEQVIASSRRYNPKAEIRGVLVQEMVPPGVEMIAGMKRDAQFGQVLVVGMGGVFVEVMKDAALALLPVSRARVEEMIHALRCRPLLEGARGRPKADVDALVDAALRLARLGADLGAEIDQLDINPLIVLPQGQGVRAVDALIVKKGAAAHDRGRTE